MSDETQTLNGYFLWRAANLWQKEIRNVLAPFELTPVQYLLLSGLQEIGNASDGPVKQADLARHCHCDPMMTSQVVRVLEKAGLVRRGSHKDDRRAVAITVADAGHQIIDDIGALLRDADQRFHDVLATQSAEFGSALKLLCGERPRQRVKARSG